MRVFDRKLESFLHAGSLAFGSAILIAFVSWATTTGFLAYAAVALGVGPLFWLIRIEMQRGRTEGRYYSLHSMPPKQFSETLRSKAGVELETVGWSPDVSRVRVGSTVGYIRGPPHGKITTASSFDAEGVRLILRLVGADE